MSEHVSHVGLQEVRGALLCFCDGEISMDAPVEAVGWGVGA